MKINSKRLKQIIREELNNIHEQDGDLNLTDLGIENPVSNDAMNAELQPIVDELVTKVRNLSKDKGLGAESLYMSSLMNMLKGKIN